jgi:hypothetical protein
VIELIPHPRTPCAAVRAISARVSRTRPDLIVSYSIEGDIGRVRLPLRGEQPLWQHTCCELFVARKGAPAYREFNFALSGEWAAYEFERYRQGVPVQVEDPQIAVRASAGRLELDARVPADGSLLLGLSAVIESDQGLSYWALRHPPGEPDFHHADCLAMELE